MDKDVRDARGGAVFGFSCLKRIARGARHAREPERNPEKTSGAERDEIRAPAVTLHEHATEKQAESGTGTDAGVDEGIDEATMPRGEMLDNDSGEAGIGGGFSDAEKKTAKEERGESAREASEKSGRGPDGESDGENFCGGKTIGEPAGENQEGRVSPEKGGEKNAELRRGNGEFAFESWRGDGKSAAVDVGDGEGKEEKDQDGPESGGEFFGWRGGVQGAEIV